MPERRGGKKRYCLLFFNILIREVFLANIRKIEVEEEFLQLDRYLQLAGLFSRRQAEEVIKEGRVTVDGVVEKRPFRRVKLIVETVRLDGKYVALQKKHVYFAFNKPSGCISSHRDPKGRKSIYDFLPKDRHLFSVGRLDYNTSGLMLITSDGELSRRLELPRYAVERIYLATIRQRLENTDIEAASKGIMMFGRKTTPILLKKASSTPNGDIVLCTLTEGRYHEVRLLFETSVKR
jgi:23S rRNA pseudouridine2605 synthase